MTADAFANSFVIIFTAYRVTADTGGTNRDGPPCGISTQA